MPTDVRSNPFADLADSAGVAPDPVYVARSRREVLATAAVAALLDGPNPAGPGGDGFYVDPSLCASPWLDALTDRLYGGAR